MSYRDLKSYQQAAAVYDFTVNFCNRYVEDRPNQSDKTDRTDRTDKTDRSNQANQTDKFHRPYKYYSRMSDQIIQAARSGKQNIVEGSSEKTSEKSELKLLGVARASFQELLEDYEDFLRQRGLARWEKDSPEAREVRNLYKSDKSGQTDWTNRTNMTDRTYSSYLSNSATAANAAICLIHQVNFLLDRQIQAAEKQFVNEGGWSENLRRKREEEKKLKLKTWLSYDR